MPSEQGDSDRDAAVLGAPGVAEDVQAALDHYAANRETCEYVGHDWAPAGGGLWICTECMSEKWGGAGD